MTARITAKSLHDRAALACKMLGLQSDEIRLQESESGWPLYRREDASYESVLECQTAAQMVAFFRGVTFGVAHG